MIGADRRALEIPVVDPEAIRQRLAALGAGAASRQIVDYWLSLSEDGELPRREAFNPAEASEVLLGCGLFDVVPGKSVHCRIAGMVFKLIFGPNVVGADWLAITAARHRTQRLVRYSAIAQGAIGLGRRAVFYEDADPVQVEEMMLPFADVAPDGTRPVLVHTDWRPRGHEWFGVDPTYAVTLAEDFFLITLD